LLAQGRSGPQQRLTMTTIIPILSAVLALAVPIALDPGALVADGGPWEIYWTDPGLERDPAKWRTEIVQPVKR
jgi:hypothetical protein